MLIMLIQFPLRVGDFRLLNLQTSLKIEGDHPRSRYGKKRLAKYMTP